jgi:hypothetical protein
LRFVLDSNEFLFVFGGAKLVPAEKLVALPLKSFPAHTICIPRTIVNEVRDNLPPILFGQFLKTVTAVAVVDEDMEVPFELGDKYECLGLKHADAFIAAYTEWANADALVTENRHFLLRQSNLPFKVLNAENCLKLIGK